MENMQEHIDCPTEDFTSGEPNGKCWGDGHYLCNNCKFLRPDFKNNWELRSDLIEGQIGLRLSFVNSKTTYVL